MLYRDRRNGLCLWLQTVYRTMSTPCRGELGFIQKLVVQPLKELLAREKKRGHVFFRKLTPESNLEHGLEKMGPAAEGLVKS